MSGGWQGRLALYYAGGLVFFGVYLFVTGLPERPLEKAPSASPKRSPLRRDLDICSTSQNIHTKAVPRPTTTPKNSNVRPGTVNMVNIRETMQAVYQRAASKSGLGAKYTEAAGIFPAVTVAILIDRTCFQPSKAAGSAADLDRVNVPTGA